MPNPEQGVTVMQAMGVLIGIVAFGASGLSCWALKMIWDLNNRVTIAETKFSESDRTMTQRFADRAAERGGQQALLDMKINAVSKDIGELKEYAHDQFAKQENLTNALHRRLDEFLNARKSGEGYTHPIHPREPRPDETHYLTQPPRLGAQHG